MASFNDEDIFPINRRFYQTQVKNCVCLTTERSFFCNRNFRISKNRILRVDQPEFISFCTRGDYNHGRSIYSL
jgi:hypothetical protein